MNRILIEKKYNKQLNIFLGIYITLCLIFALLFNGFFVKPKAYSENNSFSCLVVSDKNYAGTTSNYSKNYNFNVHSDTVFYYMPTVTRIYVDSNNYTKYMFCYVPIGRSNSSSNTISISSTHVSGDNYGDNIRDYNYIPMNLAYEEISNSLGHSNYIKSKGFFLGIDAKSDGIVDSMISTIGNYENIQYIDNIDDLQKWLNGDDTVVKTGDPENPTLPEDDSLPVPQKLGTDIQNDNVGTPPFLSGSWENPSSIYASYDASDVEVEIQYKPVFQLYKKMFNLKLAKVSSNEWLPVTKTQISNNTFNRFILYNAKTGYPNPFDSQTLHSGSLTDDVENIGNSSGYTDMFNPISARIANGTNWRIRYVVDNKTSLWVVFHVNSVGSLKNEESVSFENASGDPVSADDVNYTNSAQTTTVDKLNVNNFFDSLSNAINGIFNTTNNSFSAQDTDGSKGFYAMFKATFEKFPVFWTFFCLGLIVAILLRILGR